MGELTREDTSGEATSVGQTPVGDEGGIRIEEARWRGSEIVTLGVVESEAVVDCVLVRVVERDASEIIESGGPQESELQVVGDTFLHTFVAGEGGWEPGADYRVRCSLLGDGNYDPNYVRPFDERSVEGEPPG